MNPVRIKYYGLFWMTKRTYLIVTACAGAAIVLLLLAGFVLVPDRVPPFNWPWEPVPPYTGWLYHHFWTFILACTIAEMVDILVTLHKFRKKEAEQAQEEFGR